MASFVVMGCVTFAWYCGKLYSRQFFLRTIASQFTSLRLTLEISDLLGTMIISMTRCRVVTAAHPTVERMLSRLGRI